MRFEMRSLARFGDRMRNLPKDFDPVLYRSLHADLAEMGNDDLASHWRIHGEREGRTSSQPFSRSDLIKLVAEDADVLEIGPFTTPVLRGPRVRYFDVMGTDGLVARAKSIGYNVENPPHIDFISPRGDLAVVDRRFDIVLSSHCIEHQPDFIAHLQQIRRILNPGGYYFLIVPDKRYCFDHFITESTLAGIISAHLERRTVHTLKSVIEHRAYLTHNDAGRHWIGDHHAPILSHNLEPIVHAIQEFERANGAYIDVHAWQFTPASFKTIMMQLCQLKMTELHPLRVYPTIRNSLEFCAILRCD
jgi:SAM-dependent methyltransferase